MLRNETFQTIMNRRSVRAYADKEIESHNKQAIIDAARRAPTAGNLQMYSMIVVEDQDIKDKLSKSCDNQPFIAKAPLVIIYLADFNKLFQLYEVSGCYDFMQEKGEELRYPGLGEFILSVNDALIAAQTSVIAAESIGIGSCYIGDIMEQYTYHRELLALPDLVFPATMLCYGYPKTPSIDDRKLLPRYAEEYVVFTDKYKRFSDEEILHMTDDTAWVYQSNGKYSSGAKNIGQHLCARKYMTDYSMELFNSMTKYIDLWQ